MLTVCGRHSARPPPTPGGSAEDTCVLPWLLHTGELWSRRVWIRTRRAAPPSDHTFAGRQSLRHSAALQRSPCARPLVSENSLVTLPTDSPGRDPVQTRLQILSFTGRLHRCGILTCPCLIGGGLTTQVFMTEECIIWSFALGGKLSNKPRMININLGEW